MRAYYRVLIDTRADGPDGTTRSFSAGAIVTAEDIHADCVASMLRSGWVVPVSRPWRAWRMAQSLAAGALVVLRAPWMWTA